MFHRSVHRTPLRSDTNHSRRSVQAIERGGGDGPLEAPYGHSGDDGVAIKNHGHIMSSEVADSAIG